MGIRMWVVVGLLAMPAGVGGCVTVAGRRSAGADAGAVCAGYQPRLTLPFPSTEAHLVIQGNHGAFSHTGRYEYAWDFRMPESSPVLAAAPGVVVEVVDDFVGGGADHRLDDRANRVIVDHGDARFGVYQHLRLGGARVKEGQTVARGDEVGRSGNSGFSTEPHLHFAIVDSRNRSQPACFVDAGDGGIPAAGHRYRAQAEHARDPVPAQSTLPPDSFAANGVELSSLVPAHLWQDDVVLTGRGLSAGVEVVAFFMPRERDGRTRPFFGRLVDGRFRIEVRLAALADLGPVVDFAVAVRASNGGYHSDFTVPLLVRNLKATAQNP